MTLALAAQRAGRTSVWDAGFNGVLVVLGLMATLCPTVRQAEKDTPEMWVRESRAISWLGDTFLRSDRLSVSEWECLWPMVQRAGLSAGRWECCVLPQVIQMKLGYRNCSVAAYWNENVTAATNFGKRYTVSGQRPWGFRILFAWKMPTKNFFSCSSIIWRIWGCWYGNSPSGERRLRCLKRRKGKTVVTFETQ